MAGKRRDEEDDRDGREDRGLGAPDIMSTGEGVVESSALERITRSEIDVQIATAHRFPRSIARFKQEALSMATLDEETAAACFYVVPRAGKNIEGPSIRLAEAAARAMTNIYSSVMSIYDDPKKRIIRVTATDLESNLTFDKDVFVPKTMERSKLKPGQTALKQRTNSNGNTTYLVACSDICAGVNGEKTCVWIEIKASAYIKRVIAGRVVIDERNVE